MAYFPIIATTLPGGSPACGSPLSACATNGSFTIAGNHLITFAVAAEFIAYDNASPSSLIYPYAYDNGSPKLLRFVVQESTYDGSNTIIIPTTPIEAIADTYMQIVDSPYVVVYSDSSKTPINIPALESDSTTDLILPARAVLDFGETIDTNFLHLLENFAGPCPPGETLEGSPGVCVVDPLSTQNSPIEGQLWYDTFDKDSPIIRVWNEEDTNWDTFQGTGRDYDYEFGFNITDVGPFVDVILKARTGKLRFQQVFLNGVLQREAIDATDMASGGGGNFYVLDANTLRFNFNVGVNDEVAVQAT